MSTKKAPGGEPRDPIADLREELEPILGDVDWSGWISEKDRADRERMLARIRSKREERRMQKFLALMSLLTVT